MPYFIIYFNYDDDEKKKLFEFLFQDLIRCKVLNVHYLFKMLKAQKSQRKHELSLTLAFYTD